jgi:hypothetical protein
LQIEDGWSPRAGLAVFEAFDIPPACLASRLRNDSNVGFTYSDLSASSYAPTWSPDSTLWQQRTGRLPGRPDAESKDDIWWFGNPAITDRNTFDVQDRVSGSLFSSTVELDDDPTTTYILEWHQYLDGEGFANFVTNHGDVFLNKDSMQLMIEVNGGEWEPLSVIAHNTTNDSGEFDRYLINLARFKGKKVRFRFYFDSFDETDNDHEGVFIRDLRIAKVKHASSVPMLRSRSNRRFRPIWP